MKNFTIYELSTGKILRSGSCPGNMFLQQASEVTEYMLEGSANGRTQYIVSGAVQNKAANPATLSSATMIANGIDEVIISDLPNPTKIEVNNIIYSVIDGTFEFTVDTPGTYTILCQAFPYLDKEFGVTAS